jgi:hypothetical protein
LWVQVNEIQAFDMDESTRFYVVKLQTKGNIKLQLGTSQHAFAWIL